jgi:arabinofuranosyltransferase
VSESVLTPKRLTVLCVLAGALFLGWRELWFLTDDAFITFRHIDQHVRGFGWVWNRPPFQPVQGYSNFLWMILLEAVWRLTGMDPPHSANALSLVFSAGTLALGFGWVWSLRLPEGWERHRFTLAALVVAGAIAHRTFLTWTSSGLESALFGFCVMAWLWATWRCGENASARSLACATLAASAAALTRPDGAIFALASGLLVLDAIRRRGLRAALSAWALLAVPALFLWQRGTYGDWVPNSVIAKSSAPWWESGWRYAGSFVIEHGMFVWIGACAWAWSRGPSRRWSVAGCSMGLGIALHLGLATLWIGGDHFEYRIYSQWVVPMGVALVSLLARADLRFRAALLTVCATLVASLPVAWSHYLVTRRWHEQTGKYVEFVPLAPHWPAVFRPPLLAFDAMQAWLIPRYVAQRHLDHRIYFEWQQSVLPPRPAGRWNSDDIPIFETDGVGVPGWNFPDVAILDDYGLNDRVIARAPIPPERQALPMIAHNHVPPEGYVECLRPNVTVVERQLVITPRATPLTEESVRDCESRFGAGLKRPWW